MIIEEIELSNFRSHKKTKIKFGRGITLVVGENGAGKTSILEAINFALFKETPEKLRIDELIMHGENEMKISLTFFANGKKYKVIRSRKQGKSEDFLYELAESGQKIICIGDRQVTQEIERILRINSKIFLNAIYIRQGEIDKLLFLSPADKKEYLSKILGISEIEAAWNNMREIISEYERKKAALENVEEEIKEAEKSLEEEKEELEKTKAELEKTEEKIKAISNEKKKAGERLENLKKLREMKNRKEKLILEIEHAKENLKKIQENEKIANETRESYERYAYLEKELEGLIKESEALSKEAGAYENLRKNIETLLTELSERKGEINEERERIKKELLKIYNPSHEFFSFLSAESELKKLREEINGEVEEREEKIRETEEKINSLSQEEGRIKSTIENINESIEALEKAESFCPVCGRELDEEHKNELLLSSNEKLSENKKKLAEIKVALAREKEKKRKVESELKILKNIEIRSLELKFDEKKKIENKIEELKSELAEKEKAKEKFTEISRKIQEIKKEAKALEDAKNKHISAVEFLEREKDKRKAYVEKIVACEEEVRQIEREISKFIDESMIEAELRKAESEIERITKELIEYEKLKSRNQAIIKEKERNIEIYKRKIEELEEKKKEREKLGKFIELLKKIRNIFDKDNLQRELRARAMPVIEAYAKEIFESFEFPFTDLKIDDDFNIFVYSSNGRERAEMLSGGQKIALAIAIRIALSKALLSAGAAITLLETFLLDEPTVHLDEMRKKELVDVIRKMNYIPQSIIVTHDREFESSADRVIEIEKKNGISVVKETVLS